MSGESGGSRSSEWLSIELGFERTRLLVYLSNASDEVQTIGVDTRAARLPTRHLSVFDDQHRHVSPCLLLAGRFDELPPLQIEPRATHLVRIKAVRVRQGLIVNRHLYYVIGGGQKCLVQFGCGSIKSRLFEWPAPIDDEDTSEYQFPSSLCT